MSQHIAPEILDALPERVAFQKEDGAFIIFVKKGNLFSPAPGLKTVEEMDEVNSTWGATLDQALAAREVYESLEAEPKDEDEDAPADAPKGMSITADTVVVFASSYFSAKLGRSISAVSSVSGKGSGTMEWTCDAGHRLVGMTWDANDTVVGVYEGGLPEETVYTILGYCSYHGILTEVL
jgi:hypothetical protein